MIKKKKIQAILLTVAVIAMMCNLVLPVYAKEITDTNAKENSTVYSVEVNEHNFPDANFRDFIQVEFGNMLDESEIQATKELNLSEKSITSLQGIEYFTALKNLQCNKNSLSQLDVSKNTALQTLHCDQNQLTELDISNNTALLNLRCVANLLTSLDLSHNQALTDLACTGNYLRWLDLENNPNLKAGGINLQRFIEIPVAPRDPIYVFDMKAFLNDTPQLNRIGKIRFENLPEDASYNALTGELVYNTRPPFDQTAYYATNAHGFFSELTLLIHFVEEKYSVTFDSNGGSEIDSITDIALGTSITKPTDPTKEGYAFAGWYKDKSYTEMFNFSQPIEESTILYAKWMKEEAPTEYIVKYDSDGGTPIVNKVVHFNDSGLIPANAPTKEGYTFKGWKLGDTARTNTFITPETTYESLVSDNAITGITLVAVWEINKYTVDFSFTSGKNPDGITVPKEVTVAYGGATDEPKFTAPTNWTFDGWYTDKECKQKYDFSTPIKGNMTLFGKWTYKAPETPKTEELAKPSEPSEPTKPTTPSTPDNGTDAPKTGDDTNLNLFIALFGISAGLLLLLVGKRKKQRDL